MNCEKLSLNERLNILKMILYFDESGLKLSDIAGTMEIPKADVRKDLEIMSEELKKDGIKLIYENYKGYKLTGNKGNLLVKRLEIIEDIIRELKETGDFFNSGDSGTWHSEEYFYGYIKYENLEITRNFLELIGKELELEIHQENYNRVFSYILMLINFEELYDNKEELLTRNFLFHTPEYLAVERILGKLFKENDRKESPKKAKLLLITDLIMGINISGLKDDIFYKWINEEAVTEGLIDKVSDMINLNLREDKILITGLIDNLKFSIYRIKNDIQIINSVFKDLILNKDKNIEIVKKAVEETEKEFKINFTEYELAAMAYLVRASIKRTKRNNIKKVLLICGLGYGSSKVLEHSLKENYDLDIVDVLPYYLIKTSMPNYANIDLILSTINLEESYDIPVIKINPLLKEKDFILLSKYGIRKNITKVSLKQIMDIIKNNTTITDENKLINELKNKLGNKIIDDLSEVGIILKKMLSKNNVQFVDKVKDWKEAIVKAGDILERNGFIKQDYTKEMINMIEKHGAYIIIEEGMAIPHAPISKNVLKTGISLLIVKEKVLFPNGKGANIFLSFATTNKTEHLGILNDLFELITKYNFIEKISKITKYEELDEFFRKELIC